MKLAFFAIALLPSWLLASPGPVVAKVDGAPIYESEIREQLGRDHESGKESSREEVLDRLVLFKLSVQEAVRRGLAEDPEVKRRMEMVLYRRFLDTVLAEAKAPFLPNEKQLKAFYDKSPLIRLRHLVLMARSPEEAAGARKKADWILREAKAGRPFKELILHYSEDPGVTAHGGDLDFRGLGNLDPVFYRAGLSLKVGDISKPLEKDGALHLLQLSERRPYEKAFASYLEFLRSRLREDGEREWLTQKLALLRQKAKIEYPPTEAGPGATP